MAIRVIENTDSQEIPLGPFLSVTDGTTPLTGLSIAASDIKLWKEGASTLVDKNSGGATHMANGIYVATLNAADTSTWGPMVIFCHPSGALPVRVELFVEDIDVFYKEYNYWRTLVVAIATGTPTTTTIPITRAYPTAEASATSGTYVGMLIYSWTAGGSPAGGAVSRVVAYDGATKTLTIDPPFPVTPFAGEHFFLVPGAPGVLADNAITAAKIATGAIDADAIASNAITAAKIATDAIDNDALAASAVTEIQTGLATAAALTTVSGLVDDLESRLTATRAGYLDNLSGGAVATAAALAAVSGLVDDLESRLTAARAGYLDNLNSGVGLSAAAVDAVLDEAIEGTTTLRQAMRLLVAVAAGKSSGGGTATVKFRDLADSKDRVTATVDANGNRTAVTRNVT